MTYNALTGGFAPSAPSTAAPLAREVSTYADLPLDSSAPVGSTWRVLAGSGIPLYNRHAPGVYVRSSAGNVNRDSDYTFAGKAAQIIVDQGGSMRTVTVSSIVTNAACRAGLDGSPSTRCRPPPRPSWSTTSAATFGTLGSFMIGQICAAPKNERCKPEWTRTSILIWRRPAKPRSATCSRSTRTIPTRTPPPAKSASPST
jgi:hypothetical protein